MKELLKCLGCVVAWMLGLMAGAMVIIGITAVFLLITFA